MSSQCSPQWDARHSQECVFLLLHTEAVHHNVISLKKKKEGGSFGNAPVAEIPRARVNRLRVPERGSVTVSFHISAHERKEKHFFPCFLWIIGSVVFKGCVVLLVRICPQESHDSFKGFSGAKC